MNYNNIKFNNIKFNYVEMKTTFTGFESKFKEFMDITSGDKIAFDTRKNLYLNKKGSFQSIVRWYQSQNREESYTKMKELMTDYIAFVQMVATAIKGTNSIIMLGIGNNIIDLPKNVNQLNKKLEQCLKHLAYSYENSKDKLEDYYTKILTLRTQLMDINDILEQNVLESLGISVSKG